MTIELLRAAFRARPFCPFVIHLADGRGLPVPSPEYFGATPGGRIIAVHHPNGPYHLIDVLLMTDLEFLIRRG
jgi:hypothetical protein